MTPFLFWFIVGVTAVTLAILWTTWTQMIGAAWTPTPMNVVRRMLEVARLEKGDLLYDLGSGDGRLVIEAARRYGVKAVGIEADPSRVAWSRLMARLRGVSGKVQFYRGNIFDVDFGPATVVTVFLTQKTNQKLMPTLLKLKVGTRVVTHIWTFDGWPPTLSDEKLKVFLYTLDHSIVNRK